MQVSAKIYSSAEDILRDARARKSREAKLVSNEKTILALQAEVAALKERLAISEESRVETEKAFIALSDDYSSLQGVLMAQTVRICELEGLTDPDIAVALRTPVKRIIADVLVNFPEFTMSEVIGPSRVRRLIEARHACMKAVYSARPDLSLPQIGKLFNRDHTTVLYAVAELRKLRAVQ